MALTAKKVYAILKRQISDMEAKLNSPVRYRGTVATADLLPLNPDIGDMYNIESKSVYGEAGMNVAWNGVVWDTMGAPIDMSLYFTKEEAEAVIQRLVTEYFEKNPVKPGATTEQAQQIEQNKTDIASLKTETGSLKEDLGNKITKFYASNQGETHITDSDNGKIQDMMIYGKSSQDGTPTPENPVEIKSVVNPVVKLTNEDGLKVQSVTLNNITLNAIPVSSGGNVTIDDQQYIADYVDVGKKKRVGYILSRQISPDEIREEILSKNSCYILDNMITKPSTDAEIGHIMCSHLMQESWNNTVDKSIQGISLNSSANYIGITIASCKTVADYKDFFKNNNVTIMYQINPIYSDLLEKNSELSTYYPVTNISINSEQLDGYTVFNYPISMKNGWDYVKKQLNDNRDYIYDMDIQSAEAYVNSEYAVTLTELEV